HPAGTGHRRSARTVRTGRAATGTAHARCRGTSRGARDSHPRFGSRRTLRPGGLENARRSFRHPKGTRRSLESTAAGTPKQPRDGGSATLAGGVRSGRRALSGVALTLTDQAGAQVARCSSGPDGQFEFPVVATGTYLVIAAVDGYQPHAQSLTVRQ